MLKLPQFGNESGRYNPQHTDKQQCRSSLAARVTNEPKKFYKSARNFLPGVTFCRYIRNKLIKKCQCYNYKD